jgi:hypothetical protein
MSQAEAAKTERAKATVFGGVTPIFRVQNLQASIDYHVNVLGFQANFQHADFASVSRDRCGIFLCVGDQGNPGTWVWIGVEDVEVLLNEYRTKGAKVRNPAQQLRRGYEMQIEDLDGNVPNRVGHAEGQAHRRLARHARQYLEAVAQRRMDARGAIN